MKYGYIPDEVKLDEYILGSVDKTKTLKGTPLVPDGQWDAWLPIKELQRINWIETSNCTAFGTLNALEILHKMKYNKEKNWCERYLGIAAGTTSRGNSAHTVAETIRGVFGCIDESYLPFVDISSLDDYYSPRPLPQNLRTLGENWLQEYEFKHQWVFNGWHTIQEKQKRLREALRHSPLGISVCAWKKRGDKYWKNKGETDNHWCTLYGSVEGEYWKIFDSYDNTEKKLEWDYDFGFCKQYQLKKKTIIMLKNKLEQIYQELLVRGWKESLDGSAYLNMEEDFVRKEVGGSPERKQIIRLIEWGRKWKILNMFSGK